MDNLLVRALILALFAFLLWPAAGSAMTRDEAFAACAAYKSAWVNPPYHLGECMSPGRTSNGGPEYPDWVSVYTYDSSNTMVGVSHAWQFDPLDDNQCKARPSKSGPVDNIGSTKCDDGCLYSPEPGGDGRWGVRDRDGSMRWAGTQQWKSTGVCPAGSSLPPIPPVITKLCGGASCVDTFLNQACAGVEGGGQVCVPLNTGGNGAGPPCGGNGSMALCAGNPPPPPPNPPISDPPTQIAGTDKFTHDPGGGQPQTTTTINNYNNSGSPPNNGAGSGPDTSKPPAGQPGGDPAPAGSTAGPAGSFGGGGDCNSPPVCTGDAVMCGVAKQQWLTMCSAKGSADAQSMTVTKLFGDGNNPPESPPVQDANGLWVPSAPSDGSIGGEANEGFYNTLGFGAPSACPLHDLVVPVPGGSSVTIPLQQGCDPLGYLRYLLIAGALYRATRITMGGNG